MGWMDWEAERKVLERILALLLALAGLADRASGLPALVRLPVLAILGRAEAVARAFVMGYAFATPADGVASLAAGDAGRLATSIRALALVLAAMLAGAWPERPFSGEAGPRAGSQMKPLRPAVSKAPFALLAPDTS